MLTDKQILGILGQEITHSRGYDGTELQENHRRALRSYYGRLRGDEVQGRSQVISQDVTDTVDSVMAELSPMLKATLIEFDASSEQDEDQAQLESDFVMHVAEKSNAYEQFYSAAHNALLLKNGWLKIYIDESTEVWETEHEAVDEMDLTELVTPTTGNHTIEVIKHKPSGDDETKTDLQLKHTLVRRKLCCQSIAPEFMLHAAGHESQDLRDIRFVAEKRLMSRSELKEMGVSQEKIELLNPVNYETYYSNQERQFSTDDNRGGHEPSTEVVDVYDCILMIDTDEDGTAERWRILAGNYEANVLLMKEKAKFVHYCTGSALVMPNRTIGISMYDKVKEVEDAKTHILRQWLDNQNVANNARFGAVDGEVNMQDLVSSRPGGVVRMRSPDAIFPIPFNDVGPSCMAALQYMDQVRTERGGGAVDMQSGEMQLAGSSATAAANEYGHRERATTYYCRNLVEGLFKRAYMLIHEALRCYYDGTMQAKLHGKWAQTNPSRWVPRETCTILAGLSDSERREKKQDLALQLQFQSQALQMGMDGVLVDAGKVYATLADWTRAADLDAVENYYIDPDSQEAQQAMQQKAQQQQANQAAQEALQQRMFDQEQMLKKYMHDSQLQFDGWEAQLKAAIEEMKITGQGVVDMELEALKQEAPEPEGQNNAA